RLCARVPRGSPQRRRPRPLPSRDRSRWARTVELPAPTSHARLLGVPHRVDGSRADHCAVPRTIQPLPLEPQTRRHVGQPRMGVPRRRRMRRTRNTGCRVSRFARAPRQPHLRRELQPAASRWSGARQRQGHPGTRGVVPRRGLERHQGHLGFEVGRPACPRRRWRAVEQDERHRRRRVPALFGRRRCVHP
ncbi:MAG: hypothetical protein RLZZ199_1406, partial [Actinomycetota bacterium]